MTDEEIQKAACDRVDEYHKWASTHNRENYGRYDAFQAGASWAYERGLEDAAKVLEKSLEIYESEFGHNRVVQCTIDNIRALNTRPSNPPNVTIQVTKTTSKVRK